MGNKSNAKNTYEKNLVYLLCRVAMAL